MKYTLLLALLVSAALSLTACGYKGPLTLPEAAADESTTQ